MYHIPNNHIVYLKIFMYNIIAHTLNLFPRSIRMLLLKL